MVITPLTDASFRRVSKTMGYQAGAISTPRAPSHLSVRSERTGFGPLSMGRDRRPICRSPLVGLTHTSASRKPRTWLASGTDAKASECQHRHLEVATSLRCACCQVTTQRGCGRMLRFLRASSARRHSALARDGSGSPVEAAHKCYSTEHW
jgi:hypothetical protein